MPLSKKIAIFEALSLAFIWACLTAAGRLSLKVYSPELILFLRFGMTLLILIPVLSIYFLSNQKEHLKLFLWAAPAGIFLSLTIILQTWGLKYTNISKAGFILSLYVVFVPLLEWLLLRNIFQRKIIILLSVMIIGMLLISHPNFHNWQVGDLLMLLGALFGALQVISIGYFAKKITSAVFFCLYQMLWSALLPVCLLFFKHESFVPFFKNFQGEGLLANLAILFLVVGSFITFFLQIKSQKILSSTEASFLFLQEAPFSAILGSLLFQESLLSTEWLGGVLIFSTSILAIFQFKK